jgi:DNA-binding transcriptional regulator YiaG
MSLVQNAKREQVEVPVHIPTLDGKAIAETIMVAVEGMRDEKTGELFLDGKALEQLEKAKARHMGLLSPEEIKGLRLRLKQTQREMSDLLQIGEKTYTRWESGHGRPSQVLNLLLCALRDGRLDVGYLRSRRNVSFNWQVALDSGGVAGEPQSVVNEVNDAYAASAPNEELALAA